MGSTVAVSSQLISSAANPLLKDVRRAVSAGALTSDGFLVAESFHLLDEALRSNLEFKAAVCAASVREQVAGRLGGRSDIPIRVVEDQLLQRIAATEHSQGVIALVRPPVWQLDDLFRERALVTVLDGVQEPGNAGAIVRTAEAFGASGVVFLRGSVSPFNPKTLRASAGSLFRMPYLFGIDPATARDEFERRKLLLYAASPRAKLPIDRADWKAPCALIIGSEARGVSDMFRQSAVGLRIPTRAVESLNAAAAAAVLLYEAARQRAGPSRPGGRGESP